MTDRWRDKEIDRKSVKRRTETGERVKLKTREKANRDEMTLLLPLFPREKEHYKFTQHGLEEMKKRNDVEQKKIFKRNGKERESRKNADIYLVDVVDIGNTTSAIYYDCPFERNVFLVCLEIDMRGHHVGGAFLDIFLVDFWGGRRVCRKVRGSVETGQSAKRI